MIKGHIDNDTYMCGMTFTSVVAPVPSKSGGPQSERKTKVLNF